MFTSLHLGRLGGSYIWVLGVTCKIAARCQAHCLHLISALNKGNKQHKWCHHMRLASRPAPIALPKLPSTHLLHRDYFCTRPLLYRNQERDHKEKAGKLQELFKSCWNSQGLEVPVSTIVYIPLHADHVARSSIQVLWSTGKAATA